MSRLLTPANPATQVRPTPDPTAQVDEYADPTLDLLRRLINDGMGQWDASVLVFTTPDTLTYGTPELERVLWARLEARRIGNRARAELGLPALPVTAVEVLA